MAGLAGRRAVRYVRRAWPLILAAYRRWDRLTPEEKQRYQRAARQTVERGRSEYRKRRPPGQRR
jgi:hypothetical protein